MLHHGLSESHSPDRTHDVLFSCDVAYHSPLHVLHETNQGEADCLGSIASPQRIFQVASDLPRETISLCGWTMLHRLSGQENVSGVFERRALDSTTSFCGCMPTTRRWSNRHERKIYRVFRWTPPHREISRHSWKLSPVSEIRRLPIIKELVEYGLLISYLFIQRLWPHASTTCGPTNNYQTSKSAPVVCLDIPYLQQLHWLTFWCKKPADFHCSAEDWYLRLIKTTIKDWFNISNCTIRL